MSARAEVRAAEAAASKEDARLMAAQLAADARLAMSNQVSWKLQDLQSEAARLDEASALKAKDARAAPSSVERPSGRGDMMTIIAAHEQQAAREARERMQAQFQAAAAADVAVAEAKRARLQRVKRRCDGADEDATFSRAVDKSVGQIHADKVAAAAALEELTAVGKMKDQAEAALREAAERSQSAAGAALQLHSKAACTAEEEKTAAMAARVAAAADMADAKVPVSVVAAAAATASAERSAQQEADRSAARAAAEVAAARHRADALDAAFRSASQEARAARRKAVASSGQLRQLLSEHLASAEARTEKEAALAQQVEFAKLSSKVEANKQRAERLEQRAAAAKRGAERDKAEAAEAQGVATQSERAAKVARAAAEIALTDVHSALLRAQERSSVIAERRSESLEKATGQAKGAADAEARMRAEEKAASRAAQAGNAQAEAAAAAAKSAASREEAAAWQQRSRSLRQAEDAATALSRADDAIFKLRGEEQQAAWVVQQRTQEEEAAAFAARAAESASESAERRAAAQADAVQAARSAEALVLPQIKEADGRSKPGCSKASTLPKMSSQDAARFKAQLALASASLQAAEAQKAQENVDQAQAVYESQLRYATFAKAQADRSAEQAQDAW
eukprot:TRINITY_DN111588_c0_g1_i2.p1 TRINITY_DN111588_c0_g1~~TRINITY_DN111588_c0_g1_i2.p1  ORF type:complete len:628 (+),score=244.80 TRINITY_DN111588_c0_g1_i2:921-2804(+)